MEIKIQTPLLDEYLKRERASSGLKIMFVILGFFIGIGIVVYGLNPLLNLWDSVMEDPVENARIDAIWQQIINATAGSMFKLGDQSLCVLDASYLQTRNLKMRCKDGGGNETRFNEQRVSEIADYYPVGSAEWRRHKYVFFEDVLS